MMTGTDFRLASLLISVTSSIPSMPRSIPSCIETIGYVPLRVAAIHLGAGNSDEHGAIRRQA
jgi:hypothetical protein